LTVGGTDPKRSIDCASVGQWRQYLSAEQVAEIDGIVQETPHHIASVIGKRRGMAA
jgi:hypothetical protein